MLFNNNVILIEKVKRFLLDTKLVEQYTKIRQYIKNRLSLNRIKQIKKDGYLAPPYNIVLETNFNCNQKCSFCYQRKIRLQKEEQLSVEDIRKTFLPMNKKDIYNVLIMGGESFVRQDIFQIFDIFEDLQIPFSITTNGTLLTEEKMKIIIKYKYLKYISFSVHGWREEHDTLVRVPGAFDKVHNVISKLAKKRKGLALSFVLTKNNIHSLKKLIDFAKTLKLDEVMIAIEFATGKYSNKRQKPVDQVIFNNQEEIVYKLEKMKDYANEQGVILNYSSNLMTKKDDFSSYLKGQILTNKKRFNLFCNDLFMLRIDPKGNLVYCLLSRKIFGNVKKTPLIDLINDSKIKLERKKIANSNYFPICERCCRLDNLNV